MTRKWNRRISDWIDISGGMVQVGLSENHRPGPGWGFLGKIGSLSVMPVRLEPDSRKMFTNNWYWKSWILG